MPLTTAYWFGNLPPSRLTSYITSARGVANLSRRHAACNRQQVSSSTSAAPAALALWLFNCPSTVAEA